MKKYKCLVSALLCTAMLFVGCKTPSNPNNEEESGGTEQEAGTNTSTPVTDESDKDEDTDDEDTDDEKKDEEKKEDESTDTNDENAGKIWTVTFDLNGGDGTAPESQSIEDGKTATEPSISGITGPSDKPNFGGWTTKADDESTKFSFTTKITSDKKLYAYWSADTYYNVTYSTGTEATTTSEQVKEGSKATKPATDPRKVGYKLAGWYADSSFTTAFDFNSTISANTTVYAKFVKAYTVLSDMPGTTATTINDTYSGSQFYTNNEGFALSVGDWIIVSGTVEFDDIGQIYAQLIMDEGYPQLPNIFRKTKGTNSDSYYQIYHVTTAGTLKGVKFGCQKVVTEGSQPENMAKDTSITLKDVKLVHIAVADLPYALPYYHSKSSATLQWDTTLDTAAYQYSPACKFTAPANSKMTVSYIRPPVGNYKTHYFNTAATAWQQNYPADDAVEDENGEAGVHDWEPEKKFRRINTALSFSYDVAEETLVEYLQFGIRAQVLSGNTSEMTITNIEISNIPALSFFEKD